MTPWSVTIAARWILAIAMLAALSHLIATTAMVRQLRRAEEKAQQEIHLYKWHLEQLVPSWRSSMSRTSRGLRRLIA